MNNYKKSITTGLFLFLLVFLPLATYKYLSEYNKNRKMCPIYLEWVEEQRQNPFDPQKGGMRILDEEDVIKKCNNTLTFLNPIYHYKNISHLLLACIIFSLPLFFIRKLTLSNKPKKVFLLLGIYIFVAVVMLFLYLRAQFPISIFIGMYKTVHPLVFYSPFIFLLVLLISSFYFYKKD